MTNKKSNILIEAIAELVFAWCYMFFWPFFDSMEGFVIVFLPMTIAFSAFIIPCAACTLLFHSNTRTIVKQSVFAILYWTIYIIEFHLCSQCTTEIGNPIMDGPVFYIIAAIAGYFYGIFHLDTWFAK